MARPSLQEIVGYCNKLLRVAEFEDYPGAANGLQVENKGSVTRIAAAVDGTLTTVRMAIAAQADLLIVHHGLFWSPSHPWTGIRYKLFRLLIEGNLAVYSSHLPLDAHPRLGNNALLFRMLGLKSRKPFFTTHGSCVGFSGCGPVSRAQLAVRLEKATGVAPRIIPAGPVTCKRIGIVSGGAGGDLSIAVKDGIDTLVTGEGPHWTYGLAEELGVNVLYGGHYATETFGVKALAEDIAQKFRIPWVFLDHPTGL